jgi:large subunit ribosomal protein L1
MKDDKLLQAIKEAKEKSKKRNFTQTVELILNFQKVDFTKPENRIDVEVFLPKGRGKERKVCIIAGDELIVEAKKHGDLVIHKNDLEKYDRKKAKKLAQEYDVFIAQADLMPLVGRILGPALGPRGKMPKPVPPNAKLEPLIERMKNTIRIRTKGKFLPTVQAPIGVETMDDNELLENAKAVINTVVEKLPNKFGNIKSIFVKTTMGPAVRVEL